MEVRELPDLKERVVDSFIPDPEVLRDSVSLEEPCLRVRRVGENNPILSSLFYSYSNNVVGGVWERPGHGSTII